MQAEAARLAKEAEVAQAAQMAEDAAKTGGGWVGERLKDLDDLSILTSLNEEILLETLDRRYSVDRIYTFTGAILLAINPFKRIAGMYDEENLKRFVAKKIAEPREPHVFQIAYNAYQALCAKMKSQSILISGESGAGKTETTKYALKFIATAGAGASGEVSPVEQRVIESNPILEGFGNAKTSRNNNSSRFGKFIQLQFSHGSGRSVGINNKGEEMDRLKKIEVGSAGWRMVGASMQTYLLESVRVTKQNEGERNYHVFYQVYAATEAGEGPAAVAAALGRLKGNKMDDLSYMNQSTCRTIAKIDDLADFKAMVNAMNAFGFSDEEKANIFSTVVAVLLLGNIVFVAPPGKNEASMVSAESSKFLEGAAASIGLSPEALQQALCSRFVQTGSEKLKVDNTIAQAQVTRDSLSMKLYNMIFEELVQKVNVGIGQVPGIETQCGVLDIFGFECFPTNSLEQLCINFANESLQAFFTTFVFKREEELYQAEGIQWNPLDFPDNQDRLDLIVKKGTGIFPMLDEECFVNKGSDKAFCEKVWKAHTDNKSFIIVRNKPEWFTINHFAGPVPYLTDNFLEKNKDSLSPDCIEALAEAGNPMLKEIFGKVLSGVKEAAAAGGKKKRNTLVLQFQAQMTSLMTTVNLTDPHFIRCIKPTPLNKPGTWDSPYSAEQLRSGGVLQAIEVSRSGFAIRMNKSDVLCDFKCLAPKANYTDVEGLMKFLDQRFKLSAEGQTWAVGKNLVFLKTRAHDILQEHRMQCRDNVAKMIQESKAMRQLRKKALVARHQIEERERLRRELEADRLRMSEEDKVARAREEKERLRRLKELEEDRLRMSKEDEQAKAREEAERLRIKKEEMEAKAREEAERLRKKKEEEEAKAREEEAKLRKKKEEEEAKVREDARLREEKARKDAQEEEKRKAASSKGDPSSAAPPALAAAAGANVGAPAAAPVTAIRAADAKAGTTAAALASRDPSSAAPASLAAAPVANVGAPAAAPATPIGAADAKAGTPAAALASRDPSSAAPAALAAAPGANVAAPAAALATPIGVANAKAGTIAAAPASRDTSSPAALAAAPGANVGATAAAPATPIGAADAKSGTTAAALASRDPSSAASAALAAAPGANVGAPAAALATPIGAADAKAGTVAAALASRDPSSAALAALAAAPGANVGAPAAALATTIGAADAKAGTTAAALPSRGALATGPVASMAAAGAPAAVPASVPACGGALAATSATPAAAAGAPAAVTASGGAPLAATAPADDALVFVPTFGGGREDTTKELSAELEDEVSEVNYILRGLEPSASPLMKTSTRGLAAPSLGPSVPSAATSRDGRRPSMWPFGYLEGYDMSLLTSIANADNWPSPYGESRPAFKFKRYEERAAEFAMDREAFTPLMPSSIPPAEQSVREIDPFASLAAPKPPLPSDSSWDEFERFLFSLEQDANGKLE